ncbi:MAG: hypothetical protein Q9221_002388 [Calogaya cf. arnoldii]
MYPRAILVTVAGGLVAFAVGHDGHEESSANTCTTTATVSVSVTTDISLSSPIPTALPVTAPESPVSVSSATGPLDLLTGSAFESDISELVTGSASTTVNLFGTFTGLDTTFSLTASAITNPLDFDNPSTGSTIFLATPTTGSTVSFGSSDTTTATTATTEAETETETETSTSSTSSITTSTTARDTSTSTAGAAATTSPSGQPGSAAARLPVKSANLALAMVAGLMLLL